jgi:hypothetical protein
MRLIALNLKNFCRKSLYALVLLTAIAYDPGFSVADDFTERRITAGARIFRALLAADMDIQSKASPRGELRLCLLYLDDTRNAEIAAATLGHRDDSRIRKMKIRIEILSFAKCFAKSQPRFAGIFLTQRLNEAQLKTLVAFSKARHMVVFSPHEGDVERGVQSGIAVEARVRPYLNPVALRDAQVRLKTFFMKVAKAYEQ